VSGESPREQSAAAIGSHAGAKVNNGKRAKGSATAKPAIKVIKKNKEARATPVQLEAEIAQTEKKLSAISEQMSQPDVARDATQLVKLDQDYREAEARLAVLYNQWEEAAAKSQG
jgi:acyl carrier protein phosphodiesterase